MALLLVLLPTILAFALTRNEQCVPSPTIPTTTTPPAHPTTTPPTTTPPATTSPATTHPTTTPPTTTPPATTPPTTTPPTTTPPATTTATSTTTPKSRPHSGYQLYPGYNCYKAFPDEEKTWSEARQQCIRDGGDLMVMDSEREREEVYLPLYKSVSFYNWPWVGVYIPQAGNNWTTVKGEPALSTWWWPGWPAGGAAWKCAIAQSSGVLRNANCAETRPFICEISL